MQRRNTISAKEAKERVAKKRAERLAAMKQAEKKETEDVNLYRSAEEQSDSIDTELDQIRQTAIANGTFMKAPNGKPTNLTERQWLQVRTKAFMKWFGDWQKQYRIEKLLQSKPVEITGEEYKGKYELNRDSVKAYIKDHLRKEYKNRDTGEIILVTREGSQKVTSQGMGNDVHLKSILAIPQLIEESIFIDELPNEKDNDKYDSYRYYVTGLKIGGEDYTARLTIGVKQGNKYYDHTLTEIERGKLLNTISQNDFTTKGGAPDLLISHIKDTMLFSFALSFTQFII